MDFTDFYESNFEKLSLLARYYLQSDEALDVVQDVMTSLWEKREVLLFIDDIKSYVFSSVKHRCLDILKHETYKREYCRRTLSSLRLDLELEMQSNQSSTVREIEFKEMEQNVKFAVDSLPARCREVFMLCRFDGMPYKEVATTLGISPNTVESQMTIALKKLRARLKVS